MSSARVTVGPQVDESAAPEAADPREPVALLLRDLRAQPDGLSSREAERRLVAYGPNELRRRAGRRWPRELLKQFTHPLALLLWLAAALALVAGTPVLAGAIVAVIFLNAAFAFVQERQAERAVEALGSYLPQQAAVRRDGERRLIDARQLVPGTCCSSRRATASPQTRASSTARSRSTSRPSPASRSRFARPSSPTRPARSWRPRELVFSGTTCVGGEAAALVVATGMQTELGRIAALSERVAAEESPLEHQVKRVAWLIALVAVAAGLAFFPIGWLVAGLPLQDAFTFAVGLIVANVPEGLLPTITLALAVGVAGLARRGALVKRLSAVETLGSTTVICTDKTGTLTENRMRAGQDLDPRRRARPGDGHRRRRPPPPRIRCSAPRPGDRRVQHRGARPERTGKSRGEPTEIGMLEAARTLGVDVDVAPASTAGCSSSASTRSCG